MKQGQAVRAYLAMGHLMDERLPIRTAYALHRLRRALAPAFEFQAAREQRLMGELKPEAISPTQLRFQSAEDARRWAAEMEELSQVDVELEAQPVTVTMAEDMTLTPADIEALDGFVIFEE